MSVSGRAAAVFLSISPTQGISLSSLILPYRTKPYMPRNGNAAEGLPEQNCEQEWKDVKGNGDYITYIFSSWWNMFKWQESPSVSSYRVTVSLTFLRSFWWQLESLSSVSAVGHGISSTGQGQTIKNLFFWAPTIETKISGVEIMSITVTRFKLAYLQTDFWKSDMRVLCFMASSWVSYNLSAFLLPSTLLLVVPKNTPVFAEIHHFDGISRIKTGFFFCPLAM